MSATDVDWLSSSHENVFLKVVTTSLSRCLCPIYECTSRARRRRVVIMSKCPCAFPSTMWSPKGWLVGMVGSFTDGQTLLDGTAMARHRPRDAFLLTALLSKNEPTNRPTERPTFLSPPLSLSGLQVPGGLLLVQHGEDDLRGDAPRLLSHLQVHRCR